MQPNNDNMTDGSGAVPPQEVSPMPASPTPPTAPTPLNPPAPVINEYAQPPIVNTPPPPATFQPPVHDEQPQSVPVTPPVMDQPKPAGFMGKIKSFFTKK